MSVGVWMAIVKMIDILKTYFLLTVIGICFGSQCDLNLPSSLKTSITCLRNNTGHWISEMHLEHDSDEEGKTPWIVNVEHKRKYCKGTEILVIDVRTTVPPKTTPAGYQVAQGFGYYKIHPKIDRWVNALATCEREGAHLWIINSEDEARAVHKLIVETEEPNAWYWIGFHKVGGQYITIFNNTLQEAGYTTWGPGEPINAICGFFKINTGLGVGTCDNPRYFICEY